MPAAAHTTLIEIVNFVAQSVGHPATQDVTNTSDEAIGRMVFYANQACNEILYAHDWNHLTKPLSMAIVASTPNAKEEGYDLPPDFANFIDDTHWNRSTQLPALGPVTPQDWQWLVVRDAKITTRFMWRLRGGQIWIKSPPNTPQTLVFEYLSKNWAFNGDTNTPQEVMVNNADYHGFPWNIVVLGTRAKWLKNEGYDASMAEADLAKALEFWTGGDLGATAQSLVPGGAYPYLNPIRNLPPSGYGLP
jgi:hypothetical protein